MLILTWLEQLTKVVTGGRPHTIHTTSQIQSSPRCSHRRFGPACSTCSGNRNVRLPCYMPAANKQTIAASSAPRRPPRGSNTLTVRLYGAYHALTMQRHRQRSLPHAGLPLAGRGFAFSAAAVAVAAGLGSVLGLTAWTPRTLADVSEPPAAPSPPSPLLIVLPGGGKVELLPPATGGDWEVRVQPAAAGASTLPQPIDCGGPFVLPPPPYALDALSPYMSSATLEVHWGKHHRTYCENLNKQVAGTPLAGLASVDAVVVASWNGGKPLPSFNNAAQVWNHTFFWESMKPGGGGAPAAGGKLAEAVQRDFGGLEALRKELQAAGLSQFGSGWAWLVADDEGKLSVLKTANAVSPIVTGWTALLAVDVWEHAYYLDYQNRRADYISIFLDHLVDWDAVEARYKRLLEQTA